MTIRRKIWEKLATEWKLKNLDQLASEINLAEIDERIDNMLQGRSKGRTLVKI
jgi:acrylyl-CoA reductase (NADPH)